MRSQRRILVMGPPGSGKSTLARIIGQSLKLPVVHLDALFWNPGWVQPEASEFRDKVATAALQDNWVMDGDYTACLDLRLQRADTAIWLDLPRSVYFPRALWRSIKNYGRERDDVGIGNRERFEFAFFRDWVWTYPTRARAKQAALMAALPADVHGMTLRTRAEVTNFITGLPGSLDRSAK